MSRSVLVCVGDELLSGVTVNSNAAMIGEALLAAGLPVAWSINVPDIEDVMVDAFARAAADAPVVIVSGGLGPTQDDRTREALARLAGVDLVRDVGIVEDIRRRWEAFGRVMPEANAKQGDIPDGARPILNPYGTAPGIRMEHGGSVLYAIPGVPGEARHMVIEQILPELAAGGTAAMIRTRELKCVGMSESGLADLLDDLATAPNPRMAFLPGGGEIKLRFVAHGTTEDECIEALDHAEGVVRDRAGAFVYGMDVDTLEAVTGKLLADRGQTVATAESCTAGALAARFANVAGSSDYFLGGIVSYTAEVKQRELGVSRDTIETYGLVSEEVAKEMASGVRDRFGATYALSVTCAAGPDAHDGAAPGTLVLGIAGPDGLLEAVKARVPGDRDQVRSFATTFALNMLRTNVLQRA